MVMKEFRTYHRRQVTRASGYHVAGDYSGGECIILNSSRIVLNEDTTTISFLKKSDACNELFCKEIGMIAFGAYIKPNDHINVECFLSYKNDLADVSNKRCLKKALDPNIWNPVGFHETFSLDETLNSKVKNIQVDLIISGAKNTIIDFIGVNMGSVNHNDYLSMEKDNDNDEQTDAEKFGIYFNQKTELSVPYIYYFDCTLPFEKYLNSKIVFTPGSPVVLKSCNRCSRYLPINVESEVNTVGFANHCKKRAPCNHSTFSKYTIDNYGEISSETLNYFKGLGVLKVDDGKPYIKCYYGHQLECKACKKYYVNAKLNPMRDTQQHREDSLRRRAIEVLVDNLLNEDFIHFSFRKKNKKEFTKHIWEKFNGRCFKCGRKIGLNEMHLDHTMPLAFLYRLDETATCLCAEHNSQKSDSFPKDFYTDEEIVRLSEITGLPIDVLNSKSVNKEVALKLKNNVVWFFDEFLKNKDYQKIRDGKLTADKIYAAITRVLSGTGIDLLAEYHKKTGKNPSTITLD